MPRVQNKFRECIRTQEDDFAAARVKQEQARTDDEELQTYISKNSLCSCFKKMMLDLALPFTLLCVLRAVLLSIDDEKD